MARRLFIWLFVAWHHTFLSKDIQPNVLAEFVSAGIGQKLGHK
jgi:hypothetical protein